jgi:predicted house-cleaning noncanonical NTP pyrophosphatase (MazG superfamily)
LIRDKYKEDCANNNEYSIIRILQDDVYNDRFEWLNELDENIQKIINDKQIQNIYICKMNEYNLFK